MKNTKLAKCPYCGEYEKVTKDIVESENITCSSCNKPFRVNVKILKKLESEPLESVMEHDGYLVTQVGNGKFVLSKIIYEYETKSDAMDGLLDIMLEKQRNKTLKTPKRKPKEIVNNSKVISDFF